MSNRIKTVILDSSVWVSYLFPDDSNHQKALSIVKKYDNDEYLILVPQIVFYEVVIVLIRKNKRHLAEVFITLDFDMIFLSKEEFLGLTFRYEHYLKTKTQDTLIILHCLKYNIEYFETFDIQQRNTYNLIKSL